MTGEVETAKDAEVQGASTRWLREIDLASAHEKAWRERAEKIVKRYRDDDRKGDDGSTTSRFNVLFANTEVLKGVMYQRTPIPDVRRRFLDKDPIGRQAAQILQRALSYSVDAYDFEGTMTSVVEDVLLPGRGTACVKYKPTMGKVNGEDAVVYQEVRCDYVEWDMYRESPAKRWSKVRWIALGELMTRDDLVSAFGDKGKRCSLDWAPKEKPAEDEGDDLFKRALVWAIWEKKTKKVIFVSKGLPDEVLAEVADPLQLEDFFPVPQPVYSICTSTDRRPVPEYIQYQDQALELDNITARIDALVDQLRVRGIVTTTMGEVEKLAKAADGEMIPVEDKAQAALIMEQGGLEKAILFWPIEKIAKVLIDLYEQRDRVLQIIYQITGLSDVVRGASKAAETATAQEIKARYANVRVGPRQKAIANFSRDIFRLKAELIAEKFTPEMLKLMTGPDMWSVEQTVQDPMTGQPTRQKVDATEQIMQLLRNEKLRGFRVDIEADSTVLPDAQEEQKNRVELLTGISTFITNIGPAVQMGAVPMDVAKELLSFGVRAFKLSPQLEEALDRLGSSEGNDPMAAKKQQLEAEFAQRSQLLQEGEQKMRAEQDKLTARSHEVEKKEIKMAFEERVRGLQDQVAQREDEYAKATEQTQFDGQKQAALTEIKAMVAEFKTFAQGLLDKLSGFAKQEQAEKKVAENKDAAQQKEVEKAESQAQEKQRRSEVEGMMKSLAKMHGEVMAKMEEAMRIMAAPRELIKKGDRKMVVPMVQP